MLKEGAKTLVRFYKTLPDSLIKLKAVAKAAQLQLGGDLGIEAELSREQELERQEEQEEEAVAAAKERVTTAAFP